MKRGLILALVLSCILSAGLSGCGSSSNSSGTKTTGGAKSVGTSDWPKKDITVLVGFSAGGTSDMGTRLLFQAAQKDLGVKVIVENVTGAGGWTAWQRLSKSKPDGYTLALVTDPTIYGGYLNPSNNRKDNLDKFTFIDNQVMDDTAIAINPNEKRFTDLKSLVEYAKTHEVTATTTGVASQVHLMMLRMNDKLGTKFVPLTTKGTSEGKAMILGGNVDTFFACVGDIANSHKNKELKCITVSSEKRSEYMPDVPTMVEQGLPAIHCYSARGIMGPAGMSPELVAKIDSFLKKAAQSDFYKKEMDKMCLRVQYIEPQEYKKMIYADEAMVKGYSKLFGWAK